MSLKKRPVSAIPFTKSGTSSSQSNASLVASSHERHVGQHRQTCRCNGEIYMLFEAWSVVLAKPFSFLKVTFGHQFELHS
jgi:hypothetical protein